VSPTAKQQLSMALQVLLGEQLSSVEFVQDYLQLHSDGPTVTLFVWPIVEFAGREVHFGDATYRDELCKRISRKISEVAVAIEKSIVFSFEDGISLRVSLEDRAENGYFRRSAYPATTPLFDF